MPHLVATFIYLSQIYSYYIRGDRSPLNQPLYVTADPTPVDVDHVVRVCMF